MGEIITPVHDGAAFYHISVVGVDDQSQRTGNLGGMSVAVVEHGQHIPVEPHVMLSAETFFARQVMTGNAPEDGTS